MCNPYRGGGLYWLVELGPIDRNHACKHTERSFEIWEQCCGRWEGSYGVWIVELIYNWIRYSVGGHVWSMVQTIEAAICPSAELNCYCLRGQDQANPVPLLEAVGTFVRVFAPAAIGVRTVGFVERGMLGELCQWQAQPGGGPGVKCDTVLGTCEEVQQMCRNRTVGGSGTRLYSSLPLSNVARNAVMMCMQTLLLCI